MKTVRYLGPLDSVDLVSGGGVARGGTVDVPDELVDGVPNTVDGDGNVIASGRASLLEQTFEDVAGDVLPCFELADAAPPADPPVDPPVE